MAGNLKFTSEGDLVGPSEREYRALRIKHHKAHLSSLKGLPYLGFGIIPYLYHAGLFRYHRKRLALARLQEMRDIDNCES